MGGVKFTADVEQERTQNLQKLRSKKSWELLQTYSLVEAVRYARDNGWKQKKVQVRAERAGEEYIYYVEPYELGCKCPNILRYKDYFD